MQKDLYPIGEQSFESLRNAGSYYVDKTGFISRIVQSSSKYYFLARPRRFGKSLFLDTIKCFFEGKRLLFKGLAIDALEWDWNEYPVFRIDFNTQRYDSPDQLDIVLSELFKSWEGKYGVANDTDNLSARFKNIIEAAHRQTGRQVVILIDEYDKPLVGNINHNVSFDFFRTKLASLYSNFKSSAEHIRLVFLTGVSRFSRLNVFSDLNNINDISFDNGFADVCGITEAEMHQYFKVGIEKMAEFYNESYDRTSSRLKMNYDGYRFAENGNDIYNPWSLFNALSKSKIANYWNQTGLPTIIAESLKNVNADLRKIFNVTCRQDELEGLDLQSPRPLALLYQTGYLTIKNYDRQSDRFTLGIPNKEVTEGIFNVLLPYYFDTKSQSGYFTVDDFVRDVKSGHPEEFMKRLESFFSSMPFRLRIHSEHDLQNAIYIFISLVGLQVSAELMTSDGAIDIVISTPEYIYIIELKYNSSAQKAIGQINEKQYDKPFAMDKRQIYKIGANFNPRKRRLDEIIII